MHQLIHAVGGRGLCKSMFTQPVDKSLNDDDDDDIADIVLIYDYWSSNGGTVIVIIF